MKNKFINQKFLVKSNWKIIIQNHLIKNFLIHSQVSDNFEGSMYKINQ